MFVIAPFCLCIRISDGVVQGIMDDPTLQATRGNISHAKVISANKPPTELVLLLHLAAEITPPIEGLLLGDNKLKANCIHFWLCS